MTVKTKPISISDLRQGDTVLVNGEMQTVSKHHISHDPFFGFAFKGYGHRETNGKLEVVLFPKWLRGEIIDYVTQL